MAKTRILVVEDEVDIRDILGMALEGEGYAVDTAGSCLPIWRGRV
jgi:DNA-binding response OmpR family regulator